MFNIQKKTLNPHIRSKGCVTQALPMLCIQELMFVFFQLLITGIKPVNKNIRLEKT